MKWSLASVPPVNRPARGLQKAARALFTDPDIQIRTHESKSAERQRWLHFVAAAAKLAVIGRTASASGVLESDTAAKYVGSHQSY